MANTNSIQDTLGRLGPPSLVVVAALLFANELQSPSYESPRPTAPPLAWEPGKSPARVEALLTHDPLEVAYRTYDQVRAAKMLDPTTPDIPAAAAVGPQPSPGVAPFEWRDDACLLVLGVCVKQSGRPEDREFRVRSRYATVCALQRANLVPEDAEHLQLVRVAHASGELAVAYEWYSPGTPAGTATKGWTRVLAFWLDETAAGDHLYGHARELVRELTRGVPAHVRSSARVVIAGPTTTDAMCKLLLDADASPTGSGPSGEFASFEFLSPYATAPTGNLDIDNPRERSGSASSREISRTIGMDQELADLLVRELAARVRDLMQLDRTSAGSWRAEHPWLELLVGIVEFCKFIPPPRPVRVAIVAEQDTGYGRNWMAELKRAWKTYAEASGIDPKAVEFELFGYLRGIDGLEQADSAQASSAKPSKLDNDYPLGASQIDYVRRLEPLLTDADRFAAVGVFGSDVYDSLMILQALRPIFRDAVFFNTDLDARYFHPAHLPYTRNLVVASHLPLDVDEQAAAADGERTSLYFRDTYQHSLFATLRDVLADQPPHVPDAVVHEIGAGGPVELRTARIVQTQAASGGAPQPTEQRKATKWEQVFSAIERSFPGAWGHEVMAGEGESALHARDDALLRKVIVSCIAIAILLALMSRRPRNLDRLQVRPLAIGTLRRLALPAALLIVTAALMSEISRGSSLPNAEPLDLFSGTSVWLTVLLRAAALVYCLWSILAIRASLVKLHANVAGEPKLLGKHAVQPAPAWWRSLPRLGGDRRTLGELPHALAVRAGERVRDYQRAVPIVARALWRLLRPAQGQKSERQPLEVLWRRVGICTSDYLLLWVRLVGYALLCLRVMRPFFQLLRNPRPPVRGEFAYVLERVTLFGGVFAFFMLMCYVLEASFASTWLVSKVTDPEETSLPGAERPVREHEPRDVTDRRRRLKLAERITRTVERLVWFPVVAMSVMILSRASLIDEWSWSPVLVGNFVGYFVVLLASIVNVHAVANAAKKRMLDDVRAAHERAGEGSPEARSVERTIKEIEELRGGAFSPLWEHPLVRSAALPLVTVASTMFVDLGMLRRLLGF